MVFICSNFRCECAKPNHDGVMDLAFAGDKCGRHDIMGLPGCVAYGDQGSDKKCSDRGQCRFVYCSLKSYL